MKTDRYVVGYDGPGQAAYGLSERQWIDPLRTIGLAKQRAEEMNYPDDVTIFKLVPVRRIRAKRGKT